MGEFFNVNDGAAAVPSDNLAVKSSISLAAPCALIPPLPVINPVTPRVPPNVVLPVTAASLAKAVSYTHLTLPTI